MIAVKIKTFVTTSTNGVLSPGDILRTDPAFARHLVEECKAAEYVTSPIAPDEPVKRKRGRPAGTAD